MLLDTPICNFGWKAQPFTLKDADANVYHLNDYIGKKPLLIMFICNHCPYVIRIAKNLAKDTQTLIEEGVNVLAIMSNDYLKYEQDSPKNMKLFAKKNNFSFAYLIDEDQSVAKTYGAVCTPDFFGFNKAGELQYRGRLDDTKENETKRNTELLDAMRMILKTGNGPKDQIPSMGCSIKWKE